MPGLPLSNVAPEFVVRPRMVRAEVRGIGEFSKSDVDFKSQFEPSIEPR